MNRQATLGGIVLAVGLVGYGLGVVVAYPGRSFSVTAIMVGIALIAIRWTPVREEVAR